MNVLNQQITVVNMRSAEIQKDRFLVLKFVALDMNKMNVAIAQVTI